MADEEIGFTVNQENYGKEPAVDIDEFNRIAMEAHKSIIASNKAIIANNKAVIARVERDLKPNWYWRIFNHLEPLALWVIVLILLWRLK
jgi:hypothetical protein